MILTHARAGFGMLVIVACGAASCGKHSARVRTPVAPARIGAEETGVASWYGIPYHGRQTASGEIYDMEKLTAAHRSLPFQTWVEVTNLENGRSVDVRITDRGPFVRGRIIDLSHRAASDIEMLGPGVVKVRLKVIEPPPLPPEDVLARRAAPRNPPGKQNDPPPVRSAAVVAKPAPPVTVPSPVPTTEAAMISSSSLPDVQPALTREPVSGVGFAVQAGAFADRARAETLWSKLMETYMDARLLRGANNLWRVIVGRQLTEEQASSLSLRVKRDSGASLIIPEPE